MKIKITKNQNNHEFIEINDIKKNAKRKKKLKNKIKIKSKIRIWLFGLVCMFVGFEFSFCLSQFNNFFEYFIRGRFKEHFNNSELNQILSNLNGFFFIGGFFSSISSSKILQVFSPRLLFLVSMILIAISYLVQSWSPLIVMYIARFFTGYFIILNVILGPLILSHCCPPSYVGKLGSLFGIFNAFGVLMASLVKSKVTESYWFFFFNIPSILEVSKFVIFIFFFNFESPYFVFNRLNEKLKKENTPSKYDEAIESIEKTNLNVYNLATEQFDLKLKNDFFKDKQVEKLMNKFYLPSCIEEQKEILFEAIKKYYEERRKLTGVFKTCFSKTFRKQLLIGLLLHFARQMTGSGVVILYTKKLYQILEFSNSELLVTFGGKLTRNRIRCGQLHFYVPDRPLRAKVLVVGGPLEPGDQLLDSFVRIRNECQDSRGRWHLLVFDRFHQFFGWNVISVSSRNNAN